MADTIDWPPRRPPRRRGRLVLIVALAALIFGGGTALSYYVDALWFDSLGYGEVFWKTLDLQAIVFSVFAVVTFAVLFGSFRLLKPPRLGELTNFPLLINGQPIRLPVEPVLNLVALVASLLIALATAAGFTSDWSTLALWWYSPASSAAPDPTFAKPLTFYLFTLPALQMLSGWVMTLAVIVGGVAVFFLVVSGGTQVLRSKRDSGTSSWRGLSIAFALVLLAIAWRVYLARYDRLFDDHTIFTGVTYTDAHISLTGLLLVSIALVIGAVVALVNAVAAPKPFWLIVSVLPAGICYVGFALVSSY